MMSFAHTLVSLPFAIWLDNPSIVFTTAAVWHVICDSFLHWNIFPDLHRRYPFELVALEIGSGLLVAWLVTGDTFFTLPVIAAVSGGNLPDVAHGLWDMLSARQKKSAPHFLRAWFTFHDRIQWETNRPGRGLISQITLIAASLVVVLYSRW